MCFSMPAFDIAMPTALFAIVIGAMLLNKKVESKLKTTFEEREFRTRDVILLVAMIIIAVSIVAIFPSIQTLLLAVFLFSYSTLLFTISYVFSDMRKNRAQIFSSVFGVASLVAGAGSFLISSSDSLMFYGAIAFFGLTAFAFSTVAYEQRVKENRERPYLAVLPPALFLLLYIVFRNTAVWSPYLLDVYAVTFAVLIIVYLASLFTWKTTLLFAGLLTAVDITLVFGTKTMGPAATSLLDLGLPILVVLPHIPIQGVITFGGLGLGDFFFAGILATQTYKKFGEKTAVICALAMSISLGIFYAIQLYYQIQFFPATVNIICGWLPVVAWKMLSGRKQKQQERKIDQK